MARYKTPGVYIEEISTFPASVTQVETAIPAFIGYTEMAGFRGRSLFGMPTRITSLNEYEFRFGKAPAIKDVQVALDEDDSVLRSQFAGRFYLYDSMRLFFDNGGGPCFVVSVGSYEERPNEARIQAGIDAIEKVEEVTILVIPDAVLLDANSLFALQQSILEQCAKLHDRVGVFDLPEDFADDVAHGWQQGLEAFRTGIGINNLKYGAAYTPWIRVEYPKEIRFRTLNLSRGGVPVDLEELVKDEEEKEAVANMVSATANSRLVEAANVAMIDEGKPAIELPADEPKSSEQRFSKLVDVFLNADDAGRPRALQNLLSYLVVYLGQFDELTRGGTGGKISEVPGGFAEKDPHVSRHVRTSLEALIGSDLSVALKKLIIFWKHQNALTADAFDPNAVADAFHPTVDPGNFNADDPYWKLSLDLTDPVDRTSVVLECDYNPDIDSITLPSTVVTDDEANRERSDYLEGVFKLANAALAAMLTGVAGIEKTAEKHLLEVFPTYRAIVDSVSSESKRVPPSGAIAGVYSAVDASRGVWKAPANWGLKRVIGLTLPIDDTMQEGLNVDVVAGKSINAIRRFTGKGIRVWGARTLAGNDNEWRYISVRRFYNMVEESIKKSSSWVVFEPNDASTWVRVRGMIVNYLTGLWKQGALSGSNAEKAFFVNVGLGVTMTPQDLLEGRLIVEVGLAAVRPAEFIILRFSHKLQEV